LRGVIEREQAEIGVLISMEPPTKPMLKEAADAGSHHPPRPRRPLPRLQILTIAQLLFGKTIQFPRLLEVTYKGAPKAKQAAATQLKLGEAE
jgi:site-specific DNA-methyltransferase (adenine-specific)